MLIKNTDRNDADPLNTISHELHSKATARPMQTYQGILHYILLQHFISLSIDIIVSKWYLAYGI